MAATLLAAGLHGLLIKAPSAKPTAAAAKPAAAQPRTPTPLGPPLRGGRSLVVGPPTGGLEASPASAAGPSSTGRPSPYGARPITTPEQLRRVLVSTAPALPPPLLLLLQLPWLSAGGVVLAPACSPVLPPPSCAAHAPSPNTG